MAASCPGGDPAFRCRPCPRCRDTGADAGAPAMLTGATASAWTHYWCAAPQTGLQALTAFMKRSRMTTGSIVITGIFALPLSHLQTMIVISPESSAS